MKESLEKVAANYDVCLIDNPPTINASVINALVAGDEVIIVTTPDIIDGKFRPYFANILGISKTSLQRKEATWKVPEEVKAEVDAGNITATAACAAVFFRGRIIIFCHEPHPSNCR